MTCVCEAKNGKVVSLCGAHQEAMREEVQHAVRKTKHDTIWLCIGAVQELVKKGRDIYTSVAIAALSLAYDAIRQLVPKDSRPDKIAEGE